MPLTNGETINGDNVGHKPRILIIGAGSRGNAYARAVRDSGLGVVAAVADPIKYKRRLLGSKYIWGDNKEPLPGQEFESWQDYLEWETRRRQSDDIEQGSGITGVFVCVLDEQHVHVVTALAPLNLHMMCEKPLATTLSDCVAIYSSMLNKTLEEQKTVFGIGHVLRYSPHNMLLRKLVLEEDIVGDVLSIEHTEPVGWWHFSHSYVRYVLQCARQVAVLKAMKRKLAKGVLYCAITTHQVVPRHGLASMDALFTATQFWSSAAFAGIPDLHWISQAIPQV